MRSGTRSKELRNVGEKRAVTSALPSWTGEDIRAALRKYNRVPFQDLLSVWIENGPAVEDIRSWASRYPDRWAMAVSHISKIAGFSERREVANLNFNIAELSDSQLEDQVAAIAARIGVSTDELLKAVSEATDVAPPVIEHMPAAEVEPAAAEAAEAEVEAIAEAEEIDAHEADMGESLPPSGA